MKKNILVYKDYIIGIGLLSGIVAISTYFYPNLLYTLSGQAWCAFLMGLYTAYIHLKATQKQANNLLYSPTGEHKEFFEGLITACGINPKSIKLRYSFCAEAIAMTLLNTIGIDPIVWHGFDNDPEAIRAQEVINQYVIPNVNDIQKNSIAQAKSILNNSTQRFIFRHELAHVYYNYSYKKIAVLALVGALSGFAGLTIAARISAYLNISPVMLLIAITWSANFILDYASNLFFKLFQEKQADYFAIKYSSAEDIEAAAQFFEKLQLQREALHKETFWGKIPTEILSGHPHGFSRALYLRKAVAKKSLL